MPGAEPAEQGCHSVIMLELLHLYGLPSYRDKAISQLGAYSELSAVDSAGCQGALTDGRGRAVRAWHVPEFR